MYDGHLDIHGSVLQLLVGRQLRHHAAFTLVLFGGKFSLFEEFGHNVIGDGKEGIDSDE